MDGGGSPPVRRIVRTCSLPVLPTCGTCDAQLTVLTASPQHNETLSSCRRSQSFNSSSNVKVDKDLSPEVQTADESDNACTTSFMKEAEQASTSKLNSDADNGAETFSTIVHMRHELDSMRHQIDMGAYLVGARVERRREMLIRAAALRDEFDFGDDDDDSVSEIPPPVTYCRGAIAEGDCEVCFTSHESHVRLCCGKLVCDDCMLSYLHLGIKEAKVHFTCPTSDCTKPVSKDEILYRVQDIDVLEKYRRFLVSANLEPNKKTCPHCSFVTEMEEKPRNKFGHAVICEECGFHWCFECQSPNHEGVKCRENIKGLKALKAWAKENSHGQRNARKCPKCKLLIQRTSGCDHMTCSQCKTDFCYKCGERHISSRLFGHHYQRFSVFGCPHNLMNGRKKHLRRFVRGSVFTAKLTGATIGSAVILGLLPVALVAALFAGPVVGFMRLHKYRKAKKELKFFLMTKNQRIPLTDEDPFLQQLQRQGRLEARHELGSRFDDWFHFLMEDVRMVEDERSVSNSSLNTLGETSHNPSSVAVEVMACADVSPTQTEHVARNSEVTYL